MPVALFFPLVDAKHEHTKKFITKMFSVPSLQLALMSTLDQQPNDLFVNCVFPVHLVLSTGMKKYQRKESSKALR